jgi:hypothetical protein
MNPAAFGAAGFWMQLRTRFQPPPHWQQRPEPGAGYRALRICGVLTIVAAVAAFRPLLNRLARWASAPDAGRWGNQDPG